MKTARAIVLGAFVAMGLFAGSSAYARDVPFSEHEVASGLDRPLFVHTADLDGDGDIDIVGAGFDSDDITWWENTNANGDGSTWDVHSIDGDVDGACPS